MSAADKDIVRSWTLALAEHRGMEPRKATMLDERLARALLRDMAYLIEQRGSASLVPLTTYKGIARQIRMESYLGDLHDPPAQDVNTNHGEEKP